MFRQSNSMSCRGTCPNARRFHEALVSRCGNEPMILLIGSLELIWSAHESSVWSDDGDPMNHKTMRAALRDHQRLLDAIRDGNAARAVRLAQDHLAAARRNTLAVGTDKTIEAKLISSSPSIRIRHDKRRRSRAVRRRFATSGSRRSR